MCFKWIGTVTLSHTHTQTKSLETPTNIKPIQLSMTIHCTLSASFVSGAQYMTDYKINK